MDQETLYFDDLQVGERFSSGTYELPADEIRRFAADYDPQPFHLDEEAARNGPFGTLVASGWHTAALCMRMLVDDVIGEGSLGSPGIDEMRWKLPVRPGDTLRVRGEVLEVTPSGTKPDRGSIRSRYEVLNQRDEVVMTIVGLGMFRRRQ
jgi:acyl dehydratase